MWYMSILKPTQGTGFSWIRNVLSKVLIDDNGCSEEYSPEQPLIKRCALIINHFGILKLES